jgi:hypothetical protein
MMKSRPYLSWILAEEYNIRVSRSVWSGSEANRLSTGRQYFNKFAGDSLWLDRIPLYAPREAENPGWNVAFSTPYDNELLEVALLTAEKCSDYKTQEACLKELICRSKEPRDPFEKLEHLQRVVTGDRDGLLRTLISKYLLVTDDRSRGALRRDLIELDPRLLPGLPFELSLTEWYRLRVLRSLAISLDCGVEQIRDLEGRANDNPYSPLYLRSRTRQTFSYHEPVTVSSTAPAHISSPRRVHYLSEPEDSFVLADGDERGNKLYGLRDTKTPHRRARSFSRTRTRSGTSAEQVVDVVHRPLLEKPQPSDAPLAAPDQRELERWREPERRRELEERRRERERREQVELLTAQKPVADAAQKQKEPKARIGREEELVERRRLEMEPAQEQENLKPMARETEQAVRDRVDAASKAEAERRMRSEERTKRATEEIRLKMEAAAQAKEEERQKIEAEIRERVKDGIKERMEDLQAAEARLVQQVERWMLAGARVQVRSRTTSRSRSRRRRRREMQMKRERYEDSGDDDDDSISSDRSTKDNYAPSESAPEELIIEEVPPPRRSYTRPGPDGRTEEPQESAVEVRGKAETENRLVRYIP